MKLFLDTLNKESEMLKTCQLPGALPLDPYQGFALDQFKASRWPPNFCLNLLPQ